MSYLQCIHYVKPLIESKFWEMSVGKGIQIPKGAIKSLNPLFNFKSPKSENTALVNKAILKEDIGNTASITMNFKEKKNFTCLRKLIKTQKVSYLEVFKN